MKQNQTITLTVYHGTEAVQERDVDEVLITHRWATCGDITIRTLPTAEAVSAYKIGAIIYTEPITDWFVVEKIQLTDTKLTVSGRSLDVVLKRRVFEKTRVFTGPAKTVLEGLLSTFTGVRALPVTISVSDTITETISFQKTGATPYEVLIAICDHLELGYSVAYDSTTGQITVSVKKGKETTTVFSPEYDNLTNALLQGDIENFANFAFVAGEGEGADRKIATAGDITLAGLTRYEVYIDQRNEKKDTEDTDTTYISRLSAKGEEELAKRSYYEAMTGDILQTEQEYYGVDYDLGEYVLVEHPQWGISDTYEIVEVEEAQTTAGYSISPNFAKKG